MNLRSPNYDLKAFSESVVDLDVWEIFDAISKEIHAIAMQCQNFGIRMPKKGTKARQYFDDLKFLVPLYTGLPPTFRDGYVEDAWPMLWKMSGRLVALSNFREKWSHPMFSFSKEALIEMGREHWKEYLPQKYQDLETNGTLDQELSAAAEMTLQAMQVDQEAGYSQFEAWEANREHHLILPAEDDPEEDEEELPITPLYDAMVEMNRSLRESEDDQEDEENSVNKNLLNEDRGDGTVNYLNEQDAVKIRLQAQEFRAAGNLDESLVQTVLFQWKEGSPEMVARLEKLGILGAYAVVCVGRKQKLEKRYLRSGMSAPDSAEQASLETLLLEPEDD